MNCKYCGSKMYVASSRIIKGTWGNEDLKEIKYSCNCSDCSVTVIDKLKK